MAIGRNKICGGAVSLLKDHTPQFYDWLASHAKDLCESGISLKAAIQAEESGAIGSR